MEPSGMKTKIISTALALVMIAGFGAATQDNPRVGQNYNGELQIQQGNLTQPSFFSTITDSLLSITGAQSSYEPGETIDIKVEATFEETIMTEGMIKHASIYKCADSGCDDPPPIDSSSEDQCSDEEWWPDYDDCIAVDDDEYNYDFEMPEGDSWSYPVEFTAPQDDATYVIVGYIWKDGIVTDVSREKFTVESQDTSEPEPEPKPDVVSSGVDLTVTDSQVKADVNLENRGDGDMAGGNIVEMQVRPEGSGVLSFISDQRVCDEDYPENVHKEFELSAGDSETVSLSTSTSNLENGESYDVFIVTANDCYPDNEPVAPFGGGEQVGNFKLDQPVVNIQQGSPTQEVEVTDDYIVGNISLVNTGDKDMTESHILEMQVRPKGTGLLSALSGTQPMDTCDPDHPENVHVDFQLDSGESKDYSLRVSKSSVELGQSYDVWMITREGCGGGPVEPHGTGVIADTVKVEETITPPPPKPGLPWIPIGLAVGLVMVIGGAYYRWV
jgi:hypothetical protein